MWATEMRTCKCGRQFSAAIPNKYKKPAEMCPHCKGITGAKAHNEVLTRKRNIYQKRRKPYQPRRTI
jgi:hypothetical protein